MERKASRKTARAAKNTRAKRTSGPPDSPTKKDHDAIKRSVERTFEKLLPRTRRNAKLRKNSKRAGKCTGDVNTHSEPWRHWLELQPEPPLLDIDLTKLKVTEVPKRGGMRVFSPHVGGRIVAIEEMGKQFHLGQLVCSNGRVEMPAGAIGIVVDLLEPDSPGTTCDVISVHFQNTVAPKFMKFKDLDLLGVRS